VCPTVLITCVVINDGQFAQEILMTPMKMFFGLMIAIVLFLAYSTVHVFSTPKVQLADALNENKIAIASLQQ
jgi:hypothetical protein